jgi:hypothetical protein
LKHYGNTNLSFTNMFELQRQRSNERKNKKKKSSYKTCFFFLKFFLLLKFITSSSCLCLKLFKVLWECQLKVYKSSLNAKSNKTTSKECLAIWLLVSKCFEIFLFVFLTPYFQMTIIFSFLICFWKILIPWDVLRWGI